MTRKVPTEVGGRELTLSNLEKVLYPRDGFTKGAVVDYYRRVAPVLLPHVRDRPVTRKRCPDGVEGRTFFEKNAPAHTPGWVRTVNLPTPGSAKGRASADFVLVDGPATLVWLANLAALELHVPQWRVGPRGKVHHPDLMVFDLDPGEPATIVEACRVACALRDLLAEDGLTAHPKTSGKKGLHVYVPVRETKRTHAYARRAALRLEDAEPDLVISRMERRLRREKVFVDWSQNNPAKTTVAPYSLRVAPRPTVSTPVTWDEVESCTSPQDLVFDAETVLERIDRHGDLLAPLLREAPRLP